MQNSNEILRRGGRVLVEPLTFFVDDETKSRYDILTNVYKVKTAEYLRRVLKPDLEYVMANAEAINAEPRPPKPERTRMRKHITIWVDQATFTLYHDIKNMYPNIPRAERARAVFKPEIDRLWVIEAKDLRAG